jgi:hypothetical protein
MSDHDTSSDDMSKEFDEIVAHTEQTVGDEAVTVPVRHDKPTETPKNEISKKNTSSSVRAVPEAPHHGSGGLMVLQWLSYAFWGWLGVALTWLTTAVAVYFVTGNSDDIPGLLAYPLAAVIVMALIAVPTDLIYARREPAHKTGGQNAIMLIHTVLFVLIAVGAAVTAVFSWISMLLNTDPSEGVDGQIIALWACLAACLLFGTLAVRVLFGGKRSLLRRLYWIVAGAATLGLIITSIAGPVAGSQATKDDRVIEQGLPYVAQMINSYADEKDKLPTSLREAQESDTSSAAENAAVKDLIARGLVRYTPNTKDATKYGDDDVSYSSYYSYDTTYYYRLCVTYRNIKKSSGSYVGANSAASSSNYRTYVSIDGHAKGEVCYNLETSGYNTIYDLYNTGTSSDSSSGTGTSTKATAN